MKTVVKNAKIVTQSRILNGGMVLVDGGKIAEVGCKLSVPPEAETIDAQGRYLSPGFIDLHVHGGGGHEVMEAEPDYIVKMAKAHAAYGTTSMLVTTLAAPLGDIKAAVRAANAAMGMPGGETILGIHLEGPYLSPAQAGAQNPAYLLHPRTEEYEDLLACSPHIRMMGLAPELPGGLQLGRFLRSQGIVASIAHSDATYDQCMEAVENGFSDVTHIYSGCSLVHRVKAFRVAGVVEAGLVFDGLSVQVIADGKHLPASLLKLIVKCKGAHRISLITDGLSFSACELEEGKVYRQKNNVETIMENGVMMLPNRQVFAGSIATVDMLVRNIIRLADVSIIDAVRMATASPARVVGAHRHKGALAPGMDADIVLFDEDINVSLTMSGGRIIFKK